MTRPKIKINMDCKANNKEWFEEIITKKQSKPIKWKIKDNSIMLDEPEIQHYYIPWDMIENQSEILAVLPEDLKAYYGG